MQISLGSAAPRIACGMGMMVLSVLSTSCGDIPSATQPALPRPVVQILLGAHLAEQSAVVQYSLPAGSHVVVEARPIRADSVALAIRTPAGTEVPFTPVVGTPGRFVAAIRVLPGETYYLAGAVVGRSVEARTTVPGRLEVREPAADTLRLPAAALEQVGQVEVPYAWYAPGAVVYQILFTSTPGPLSGARFIQDTSGVLLAEFDLFPGRPEPSEFIVVAYDSVAGAFHIPLGGSDPRPGNITGALGYFGAAATLARPKVVLWE